MTHGPEFLVCACAFHKPSNLPRRRAGTGKAAPIQRPLHLPLCDSRQLTTTNACEHARPKPTDENPKGDRPCSSPHYRLRLNPPPSALHGESAAGETAAPMGVGLFATEVFHTFAVIHPKEFSPGLGRLQRQASRLLPEIFPLTIANRGRCISWLVATSARFPRNSKRHASRRATRRLGACW